MSTRGSEVHATAPGPGAAPVGGGLMGAAPPFQSSLYPPQSDEHALIAGMAFGAALRAGLDAEMIDDEDGNHQAAFLIHLPEPMGPIDRIVVVVPPPTVE